ncbi:MAG: hypothetical protein ACFE94_11730 [Candidatus Hodarchaeota archaeon]
MVKSKEFSTSIGHSSIRYCGNCTKEYKFSNFIQKYPEPHHDKIIKLWQNPEITFYCSYCYLLKIIREIKRIKRPDG